MTSRVVTGQRVHQQLRVRPLQVLPAGVRFPGAHGGQIPGDLHPRPIRPGDQLRRVTERHRTGAALGRSPRIEPRKGLHRKIPTRRGQPRLQRAGQPMLRINRQRLAQLPAIREHRNPPRRKEFRPTLQHQSVGPPRQGTRRPADRKLPQPLVHHRRRPRPTPVLEPQIIIDQHRHLVPDRRTAAQRPAFPTVGAEVVNKHSSSKAGATDSPD